MPIPMTLPAGFGTTPTVAAHPPAGGGVVIAGLSCPGSGQPDIDNRSEGLAFVLGHLFEPMVECRRRFGHCDRTQCARLTALLTFLDRNFSAEETLMDQTAFPGQDRHRREHGHVLHVLRHMRAANLCADDHGAVVRAVVGRWLARHVRDADHDLGRWVSAQGDDPAPRPPVGVD